MAGERGDMTFKSLHDFVAAHRLRCGPLGDHLAAFAALLAEKGYAMATRKQQLRLMAALGNWLERRHASVSALDENVAAQFLRQRRRHHRITRSDRATLRHTIEMLRDMRVICPAVVHATSSPVECMALAFSQHLLLERGLSASTRVNYVPVVRRLLSQCFDDGPIKLDELCAADVMRFVACSTRTSSPGRAKLIVTALRAFLLWLHRRGDTRTNLAGAVPRVADRRLVTLPKSIAPEQVERLLRHCDRGTVVGRRDYAILLVLARMGLRAGEVVAMELDDLDWQFGEIIVRGKGGRRDCLPLPRDVGAAVADYLRRGRPSCSTRRVFVRRRAPRRGFANSIAICTIVERALTRAGLDPPRKGAHLLRHSLACTMLRRGASLAEIGDVLRHRSLDTTAIYAKVDVAALRAIAPAWPRSAGEP